MALWLYLGSVQSWGARLALPQSNEIVSFASNTVVEHRCSGASTLSLPLKSFLAFLSKGKVINGADPETFLLAGPASMPKEIWPQRKLLMQKEGIEQVGTNAMFLACAGCAATSEKIYFWQLLNDWYLWLLDENGDDCVLDLSSIAFDPKLAQFGKPVEGQIVPPSVQDIKLVANTPIQWTWRNLIRVPIERSRIMAFFTEGIALDPFKKQKLTPSLVSHWESDQFTLPTNVTRELKSSLDARSAESKKNKVPFQLTKEVMAEGAIVTDSQGILFWQLENDYKLHLWNAAHQELYLVK